MRIEKFGVERWMDLYETRCAHNLAETCVESITLAELAELAGKRDFLTDLPAMKMTYGAIPGSDRLRRAIAGLYHSQGKNNVLVTHGAIGANALVYQTLVEPGDHVVVTTPAYQQHLAMPRCYGARTSVLPLREENGFLPDVAELRQLLTPATKLLVFTNPNNPTGALMNRALLEDIAALAGQHGTYILCDEVYRGLDDTGDTPSMADLYEWGISTGSMSKAFSLAGLRLGWIVTGMAGILENAITHRDYTTISVGMLDDYFAAVALEAADAVLARSRRITRENRRILANWAEEEPAISWTPPQSGTTALLKYQCAVPSWDLCVRLAEETGVMLCPGSVMDMEGYVRIGYANNAAVLRRGLELFSGFLRKLT